jgi:hypothetical protein
VTNLIGQSLRGYDIIVKIGEGSRAHALAAVWLAANSAPLK